MMLLLRIRVWLSDMTESVWQKDKLEQHMRECCQFEGVDFRDAAQLLRAAITGSQASPSIFSVCVILGRDETLGRIDDCLSPDDLAVVHATSFPRPEPAKVKLLLRQIEGG
jgi:hypothetical protein